MFVDDALSYVDGYDLPEVVDKIKSDLANVNKRLSEHELKLNTDKTNVMWIGSAIQ